MKILHVSYAYGANFTGGATIAATRLHNYLLDVGVESYFMCILKFEEGRNVIEWPPCGSLRRWLHLKLAKIERNVWRFTPYRRKIDLNIVPLGIKKVINAIQPDIVQIHNIGAGMVQFEEFCGLKIPIILTQHDFWKINGFDPCPYSDTRLFTGFNKSNSQWLERWLWGRKYRLSREPNVSYIAPSKWAEVVTRRSLCGEGKVIDLVPNFIGPEFKYFPSKRTEHKKFRILFGCNCGMKNEFKGFSDLEEALRCLPVKIQRNSELHVFGDKSADFKIGEICVKVCGIMHNAEELVAMYHSADILAFPSKTETQGMVKIEALLCGLPVIVFDRTACPEAITHGKNGWIAGAADIKGFAEGIVHFYNEWGLGELEHKRRDISNDAVSRFSNKAIMDIVLKVYQKLLGNKGCF